MSLHWLIKIKIIKLWQHLFKPTLFPVVPLHPSLCWPPCQPQANYLSFEICASFSICWEFLGRFIPYILKVRKTGANFLQIFELFVFCQKNGWDIVQLFNIVKILKYHNLNRKTMMISLWVRWGNLWCPSSSGEKFWQSKPCCSGFCPLQNISFSDPAFQLTCARNKSYKLTEFARFA